MIIRELGFSYVVQVLIDEFKTRKDCPIIGHNMIYDILYFYNQFVGPLPDTYSEFV